MFLHWDAIRVVIKYGWDAIRVVVKYLWDAIHVEKGFWDAIHVQRHVDRMPLFSIFFFIILRKIIYNILFRENYYNKKI